MFILCYFNAGVVRPLRSLSLFWTPHYVVERSRWPTSSVLSHAVSLPSLWPREWLRSAPSVWATQWATRFAWRLSGYGHFRHVHLVWSILNINILKSPILPKYMQPSFVLQNNDFCLSCHWLLSSVRRLPPDCCTAPPACY